MSGKQRRAKRLVGQDQWLSEFGSAYAHPRVTEHDLHIPEDQRTEDNARVPEDHRQQFALALLARALALINKSSRFRPISLLGMPDGDPLLQFDYLVSCYEQVRRPGPPKKRRRPPGKPGAPRKWTKSIYELLLNLTESGRAALEERGRNGVSDQEALAEAVRRLWTEAGKPLRAQELNGVVGTLRRRISEARKVARPAPKTPG
jgi:hypothetical protein